MIKVDISVVMICGRFLSIGVNNEIKVIGRMKLRLSLYGMFCLVVVLIVDMMIYIGVIGVVILKK